MKQIQIATQIKELSMRKMEIKKAIIAIRAEKLARLKDNIAG